MIIKIESALNGSHANQSTTPIIIPNGWIEVPSHLESIFIESGSFCDLEIENGMLVGITPTERPPEPTPEPIIDPEDDRDSMLIDHEYRLTLIELGV